MITEPRHHLQSGLPFTLDEQVANVQGGQTDGLRLTLVGNPGRGMSMITEPHHYLQFGLPEDGSQKEFHVPSLKEDVH